MKDTGLTAYFGATIELGDKTPGKDETVSKAESFALQLFVKVGTAVPIRFGLTLPPGKYVSLKDILKFVGKQFGITQELTFSGFWKEIVELQVRPEISAGPSASGGSADIKGSLMLKDKWELPPKSWWPEPFIEVSGISIFYKQGGMDFSVDAKFFGRDLTLEYPLSTPAPKLPLIDLKYFALGQRVGIDTEATDVLGIIDEMREKIKQVDGDGITRNFIDLYKPERNLLFASRLSIRDLIDLSVIFNDPVVYGLAVSFGDKIAVLKGFKFEILYKKISDDVGLFYIDLSLPEAIRQIEFGAASVTLPCVAISIYTNGDFKIAIGWPLGDRSVVVQLIVMIGPVPVPFLGGGGCYFGKLSSSTMPDVAVKNLNPIIAFGVALEIGLGKSFNKGILSAKLSVTLHGILEGSLGWHAPAPNERDTGFELMVPDYFMFQGTLGIVGIVEGEVSFAIIKAAVLVRIGADVTVRFETAKDVAITVAAYVDVALKVEIGGFKVFGKRIAITVKLSFKAHISETFMIEGTGAKSLALHFLNSRTKIIVPIDWNPNLIVLSKSATPLAKIPLVFMPQITLAEEDNKLKAHFVTSLTISTITQEEKGPSPFELLVEKTVIWMVFGWKKKSIPPNKATNESLTRSDLQNIIKALSLPNMLSAGGSANRPLNYENLKQYLKSCIVFSLSAAKELPEKSDQSEGTSNAAAFPVFPDLQLAVTGMTENINFNEINRRPESFANQLEKYFDTMRSVFNLDDSLPTSKSFPIPTRSLATYIFEDYFAMLLKAATASMLDQFDPVSNDPKTLGELLKPRGTIEDGGLDYELLAGTVSRFSYHGLRIPTKFGPPDQWAELETTPLYTATGQQFAVNLPKDTDLNSPYSIALSNIGAEDWLTFAEPKPKFEISKQQDFDALRSFETLDLSLGTISAVLSEPLRKEPSRFVLQNRSLWQQDNEETPHTLLRFSNPLEAAISMQTNPLSAELFLREVGAEQKGGEQSQASPVAYRPALLVDLTLKQIETDAEVNFNEKSTLLKHVYQIGGTDEKSRMMLKKLLVANVLDNAKIDILYSEETKTSNGELFSQAMSLNDVVLIKTNLSTESNPDEASFAKALPRSEPQDVVYAFLTDTQDFLQIIWECSIVNSGGFYLRYISESGEDLPDDLFESGPTISIQLAISFAESVPLEHYHNALVIAPDTATSSTTGTSRATGTNKLYSIIAQELSVWQPTIPAGCLSYEVKRDNPNWNSNGDLVAEVEDKTQVENLFNLLRCRVGDKEGFCNSIWGLPIGPADDNPVNKGSHDVTDEPKQWTYRQVVPAFRYVGTVPNNNHNNRYAGVGKKINLNFEILDLFGNLFPGQGVPDINSELIYFDRLCSITEWPGVSAVYQIANAGGEVQIGINFQFDKTMFKGKSVDDGIENGKAEEALKIYALVRDQVSDRNSSINVRTTLAPKMDAPFSTEDLISFIQSITNFLSGLDPDKDDERLERTVWFTLTKERPKDYLFPIKVEIEFSRPESLADGRDPLVAKIVSEIAPDISSDDTNKSDTLAAFAERFESAMGGTVKLAQGPVKHNEGKKWSGSASENIALFGVRFGTVNQGIEVTFKPNESPLYYALPPLSTKLLSETFADIIDYKTADIEDIQLVSRKFTNIDLDIWAKEFLAALDSFIGPHRGIATCKVDPDAYRQLMAWKKSIASAIANRIEFVFGDDEDRLAKENLEQEGRKDAVRTFYQRLLIDLRSAYEIGTVIQAEANVFVPNEIQESGPRKLYGQLKKAGKNANTQDSAINDGDDFNFSTSKLTLSSGPQLLTGIFSVAQPTSYLPKVSQLAYDVSFLEHDISLEGSSQDSDDKYLSSSWLKFVLPGTDDSKRTNTIKSVKDLYYAVSDKAEIPVPLRRYPAASALKQHNAQPMHSKLVTLKDAVLWQYNLSYQQQSIAQDSFELIVQYNKGSSLDITTKGLLENDKNRLRPLPKSLFEALARFYSEYPALKGQFEFLDKADKNAKKVIERFLELVEGVNHILNPEEGILTKEISSPDPRLKEIRSRYYFNQPKDDEISVRRYRDEQGKWPSWPSIANYHMTPSDKTDDDSVDYEPGLYELGLYKLDTGDNNQEIDVTISSVDSGLKESTSDHQSGRYWRHSISLPDCDVRTMENALCTMQLFRNASLVANRETADVFVYRTPAISFSSSVTPLIEVNDRLDLKVFTKKSLSQYLVAFFDALFYKDSSELKMLTERQYNIALSVEVGFPLVDRSNLGGEHQQVIEAKLPVALSPNILINQETLQQTVGMLVKSYRSWYENAGLEASASSNGALYFDLKVFSSLSESRLPIIHMSEIVLEMESNLDWWS